MKLLANENIARGAVEELRRRGYDVVAAAEEMVSAPDADVLARAEREGRVLVTKDKDFGELAYRQGRKQVGVVLLRLRDDRALPTAEMCDRALRTLGERIVGRFAVVTEGALRLR